MVDTWQPSKEVLFFFYLKYKRGEAESVFLREKEAARVLGFFLGGNVFF